MVKKRKGLSGNVKRKLQSLFIRYLILVLVALPGMALFYYAFRPLTVYPVYGLLSIFFQVDLINPIVLIIENSLPIEFVSACIAGAAYYLLLILNLSIPDIKIKKRIKMVVFAFIVFLIINILRIFVLSLMAYNGSSFFDITHRFFWYSLSTVFVVLIWFAEVKYFKIKQIPFYSDIKFLANSIKRKK